MKAIAIYAAGADLDVLRNPRSLRRFISNVAPESPADFHTSRRHGALTLDACICQTAASSADSDDEALQALADVRAACPVLNQIILPDSVWPDFHAWHGQPDVVALHRSIFILA